MSVWKPGTMPKEYRFSTIYDCENGKTRCKVCTREKEKIVQIFAFDKECKCQTITIIEGEVTFNDGEYENDLSTKVFEEEFIELAMKLPEEVKRMFGGCFGIK